MLTRTLAALATAFGFATPALSDSTDGVVQATLLPGWRQADGTHLAGLKLVLDEGWKTYWRAPGDAGIPPIFDWRGSRNVTAARVIWPTPQAFDQNGMRSLGYDGTVILPVVMTPGSDNGDITLKGKIEIGVCLDICVPKTLKLRGTLPASQDRPDPVLAAALANRPYSAEEAGVRSATCTIRPSDYGIKVTAQVTMPELSGSEIGVLESGDPSVWAGEATALRSGNTLTIEAEMMQMDGKAFLLDRSAIRITVIGGGAAVDIRGCPSG